MKKNTTWHTTTTTTTTTTTSIAHTPHAHSADAGRVGGQHAQEGSHAEWVAE
jgi:hypothetical protein